MKYLFVLLLTINLSQQLTKNQFDALYFKQDYFGEVEQVVYLSQNKICLINRKGFKLIDLDTQETLYFVSQNIEQMQVIENNNLLVKDKREILQFNLHNGRMVKKTKSYAKYFHQFLYVDGSLYFSNGGSVIKQISSDEVMFQSFQDRINCLMYQKKTNSFLVLLQEKGEIVQLDANMNQQTQTNSNMKLFENKDMFDSGKFIVDKDNLKDNIKQVLDNVLLNKVEATEQYQIMKTKKGLEVMNSVGEEVLVLSAQDLMEQPKKMFTNGKLFIVQSKLLTLDVYRMNDKQKLYTSEESLADIKSIEFFLQHDTREHLAHFMTYQRLLNEKKYTEAWKTRLQVNTMIMKENFSSFVDTTKQVVQNVFAFNVEGLKQVFNKKNAQLQTKIAIILTNNGKVLKFNMKTNKVESHLKLYQQDLQLIKEDDQVFSLSTKGENNKEYYDVNFNVLKNEQQQNQVQSKYQFKVDRENNSITGYYDKNETWKIDFKQNEKILKYQTMQDTNIPLNSFVIEKNHVLYKLIDPNNFILVTQHKQDTKVYIINSKFGKILGQYKVNINTQNYQLLVDDNSFFVIYYDNFKHLTEIVHFEIFRTKIEKELMPIIQTSWQSNNQKLEEIDYNSYDSEYVLMQKSYGTDIIVKKVFAFDSANDLTSKNLLVLTKSNKLYSIPRDLLSTRRCLKEEKEKAMKNIQRVNEKKIRRENYYKSQILPDYEYKVVLTEKDLISGNLDLINSDQIYVSPSIFESTSDLIVTGQSFLTLQHSPDLLYDQLPNSFDKLKLIGFLAVLVVAYIVLSFWQKNKAKFQNFDTN